MQILTKEQVKYCRLVTKKSAAIDYCLGISFQDKLYIADKFFAGDRQQQAIDYCYRRYLADKGKKSYILLSNVAGLTVWQEDELATIIGEKKPENLISNLEINGFIVQMRDAKILISDPEGYAERNRQNDPKTNKLLENIEMSLQTIASLEQQVREGFWLQVCRVDRAFREQPL